MAMKLFKNNARESRGLVPSDPFESLRNEMEEMFSRFNQGWNGEPIDELSLPSTDISETDGNIEVTVDVPGMKPDDLDIEVRGNMLEIRGEHQEEKEDKDKTYHRIERRSGSIRRTLRLPSEVDASNVEAECKDGVLKIKLPKTEEAKKRRIEVKG